MFQARFGHFEKICSIVSLPICPLLGYKNQGLQCSCYTRSWSIGDRILFEPGTLIIELITLCLLIIMLYNVNRKYTAIGRKEITHFFYLYLITVILDMILVSNIVLVTSPAYRWIVAAYVSLISTTIWCLLLNGLVGYQFVEDGTPLSLWSLRVSCGAVFLLVYAATIATTYNWRPGFNSSEPYALFIIYFILNGVALLIYTVLQVVLVWQTLEERWPLGVILLALLNLVVGVVIIFGISDMICKKLNHYFGGMFFGSICMLFSVMMIYKYWDSITQENLEYSFGSCHDTWEVYEERYGKDRLQEKYLEYEFDVLPPVNYRKFIH